MVCSLLRVRGVFREWSLFREGAGSRFFSVVVVGSIHCRDGVIGSVWRDEFVEKSFPSELAIWKSILAIWVAMVARSVSNVWIACYICPAEG